MFSQLNSIRSNPPKCHRVEFVVANVPPNPPHVRRNEV
jgi:hypothetical protein